MTEEIKDKEVEVPVEEKPVDSSPKEVSCPENECYVENNVMTIKLYLWGEAAYAKTLGSIELSKDIARGHFASLATQRNLSRPKIIKPNGSIIH